MNKLTLTPESEQALRNNPIDTATWVKGLRSGNYVQNRGGMCDIDIPNSACCLHVLEMDAGGKAWEDGANSWGSLELPSEMVGESVMFDDFLAEDIKAVVNLGRKESPAQWNDDLKLTFNQIATLLETGSVEY
jgi:hypothetical protein